MVLCVLTIHKSPLKNAGTIHKSPLKNVIDHFLLVYQASSMPSIGLDVTSYEYL